MVSAISNVSNVQQTFMNNITQENQQNCLAYVSNSANNNVFIINGASISGNVVGVQQATVTDATCLIVSNMESSLANTISSIVNQSNSAATDWFNGFQVTDETNTFNINQSITNNINQINQSLCSANATVSASNNYVYIGNTKIGGNFTGVVDTANASANCSMTNNMKNTTYNQAQSSATQSNSVEGMFVAMAGAFALVLGLIIIAVIVMYSVGPIDHVGYKAGKQPTPEEQELATIEALGITPEQLSTLART